jgi:hypothetical protein
MTDWITDGEIAAIRNRVTRGTFAEKRTRTYCWYVRFFWFGLATCWLVASLVTLGHDRHTVEALVFCLLVSAYYQVQWKRHCENYVLYLEIKKIEESNNASQPIAGKSGSG